MAQTPPVTEADRAAAFPDVKSHAVHDDTINWFVLFDQLEWLAGNDAGANWDTKGWIGGDVNRFWFRTEGAADGDRLESAEAHLFYGRAIAPWWEVVAGIRQEARPGPAQTWAAIGLQGIAPYWFQIEATAYLGASGRTEFRFETEYELLLSNRLVAQPLVEIQLRGKADPERRLGAGLSEAEIGVRLRYELRREVAPYIGIVWDRKFFGTADYARAAGETIGGARLALGARVFF